MTFYNYFGKIVKNTKRGNKMSYNVVIISPKSSSDNEQNKEYELAGRIKEQLEYA